MNHSSVLVSGQILQIYKSEKFLKSHVVLEGVVEEVGGLPFKSEVDGDACGQGLGAAFGSTTSSGKIYHLSKVVLVRRLK